MDLALAHLLSRKLVAEGKPVDRWQLSALMLPASRKSVSSRTLALASVPIAIAARGSKLAGGGLRTELTRAEIDNAWSTAFSRGRWNGAPATRARTGLTQLGLPYAQDPAVTKHLAAFLGRQAGALERLSGLPSAPDARPAHVTSSHRRALQRRRHEGQRPPRARGHHPEPLARPTMAPPPSACSMGPTSTWPSRGVRLRFGLARHGRGIRIRGGTARAYYVGIESAVPAVPGVEPPITALCVAPFGMEEGTTAKLPPHELGVIVGEPVRFRFFGSIGATSRTRPASSSTHGPRTSSKSSRPLRSRCPPRAVGRAMWCRFGFTPPLPRSARCSWRPFPRSPKSPMSGGSSSSASAGTVARQPASSLAEHPKRPPHHSIAFGQSQRSIGFRGRNTAIEDVADCSNDVARQARLLPQQLDTEAAHSAGDEVATRCSAFWDAAWKTVLRQPTSASTGCATPVRSRREMLWRSQGRPQVRSSWPSKGGPRRHSAPCRRGASDDELPPRRTAQTVPSRERRAGARRGRRQA